MKHDHYVNMVIKMTLYIVIFIYAGFSIPQVIGLEECVGPVGMVKPHPYANNRYFKCYPPAWKEYSCLTGYQFNVTLNRCQYVKKNFRNLNVEKEEIKPLPPPRIQQDNQSDQAPLIKRIILNLKPVYPLTLLRDENNSGSSVILHYNDQKPATWLTPPLRTNNESRIEWTINNYSTSKPYIVTRPTTRNYQTTSEILSISTFEPTTTTEESHITSSPAINNFSTPKPYIFTGPTTRNYQTTSEILSTSTFKPTTMTTTTTEESRISSSSTSKLPEATPVSSATTTTTVPTSTEDDSYEEPEWHLDYNIDPRMSDDNPNYLLSLLPEQTELLPTKCGRRLVTDEEKIFGGIEVSIKKYPWQASLKYSSNKRHFCGASIISSQFLISAAHCFKYEFKHEDFYVRVGDTNMDVYEGTEVDHEVETFIKHKQFTRQFASNENDIALVKIKKHFDFNEAVQPVCLPTYKEEKEEVSCTISGWGKIETTYKESRHLRAAHVPIIKHSKCSSSYRGRHIPTSMFCAGTKAGGVDSCNGDSGGPLVCPDDGKYILYGITSWGAGCGDAAHPGVYTRVSMYRRWIETEMNYLTVSPDFGKGNEIFSNDPEEYEDKDIF